MLERLISLSGAADTTKIVSEKAGSVGEALGYGGSVTLLGVSIVFLGLFSLIIITWLYPKIAKVLIDKSSVIKANKAIKKAAKLTAKKSVVVCEIKNTNKIAEQTMNDKELIAVITAAIAASMGASSNGITIRSLRRSRSNAPAWGLEGRNEQVYNRF